MIPLIDFLAAAALLLAAQESSPATTPLEFLQSDPELKRFTWTELHTPSYSPLLLLVATESGADPAVAQDLESSFGPALTALVDLWRSEWAQPLELAPAAPNARAALAFLPSFQIHKDIAAKKFPQLETIPASYLLGEIAITYLHGNAFESKVARRNAVLGRAAERLLALYRPAGGTKDLPAWLHLGLSTYLGEIREKGEGQPERYFGREESKDWRDARARAADELKELKIPPPSFEEILKLGPESAIASKPRAYREFVRLSGYAWILLFRSQQTERFAKPLRAYLKDEFRGEGGLERFRAHMQGQAAPFLKDWEAFCGSSDVPAEKPPASAPVAAPPNPPKKNASTAGKLSPVVLDMTPRTLIDLRAEVLRKVRSLRFDDALHEVYDVREKQSDVLKPYLAAEKRMVESSLGIYEAFGKNCKPGDRLAANFGHAGEIVRCHADGTFELREKTGVNRYRWTELSLQAVSNYAYGTMKRNGPDETLDHATALLISGNLEAAKTVLATALANGASPQRTDWLMKMLPDFERALKEAKARDAFEEISLLDLPHAVEKLRQRLLDPDIRVSAAREYATPFLEGMLSVHFGAQFEKKGLPSLFRGKLTAEEGGITLRYAFDDEGDLADWEPFPLPEIAKQVGAKADGTVPWGCMKGDLRIHAGGARAHVATWAGDWKITIAVEFESQDPPPTPQDGFRELLAGIAFDGKGFRTSKDPSSTPWETGSSHQLSFARSGEKIVSTLDGKDSAPLDAKGLGAGRIFLLAPAGATFLVHEISISGKLDTQSAWYRTRKSGWVLREIEGVLAR